MIYIMVSVLFSLFLLVMNCSLFIIIVSERIEASKIIKTKLKGKKKKEKSKPFHSKTRLEVFI